MWCVCVCASICTRVHCVRPMPAISLLHTLITDYRERKKIMLNVEHRLMLQVSECGVERARDGRGVDW